MYQLVRGAGVGVFPSGVRHCADGARKMPRTRISLVYQNGRQPHSIVADLLMQARTPSTHFNFRGKETHAR